MPSPYIPQAFIDYIASQLPPHHSLETFLQTCQRPLRKSIRVNTLFTEVEDFYRKMTARGWKLSPIPWCQQGFWVERPAEQETVQPLGSTPEHLAGQFYIQEASSMLPAEILFGNALPQTVLDMAAAPGSKTTQIAALMQNKGLLVANELSASRIKTLAAAIQRLGVNNTALSHFDAEVFGEWLPESFDGVLLDAPCGGEGTIRKDPDALRNWSEASIATLSSVQRNLIDSAFKALKPGGYLVYSTCTLNQQENQAVCQYLLERYQDAVEISPLEQAFSGAEKITTEQGFLHVWPQVYDTEGFFVARLKKVRSLNLPAANARKAKLPYVPATRKQRQQFCTYLSDQFGTELDDTAQIYVRDREYWLFPDQIAPFLTQFRFQRIGVRLATEHKSGYRLSHDGALCLGRHMTRQVLALDTAQLRAFYQGKDLFMPTPPPQGEVILTWQGSAIGVGKGLGSKLKNLLPRELVRDKLSDWNHA
ncbi:16S rRNA (cytosine(1407)-C(5))-methyltransferase RsmF [Lacimicrobium sp. SS2-24]|uniref:16S rRNA (cytosine(1407)-C(5))-methyltransferase RsmF n=1 Tax=Lacimicrobium sp. SS2-24 TaxID=2005569 RepID=UPI000B4AD89F|nr:16S rRNA (cytosine(1407)-C(5))-methyltransferase RsmF [Lacimicrobium sp. SS2-24]